MKKKKIKHFVPNKDRVHNNGVPACRCFDHLLAKNIPALIHLGEVAKGRRDTNCGSCRRTKVFRKLK